MPAYFLRQRFSSGTRLGRVRSDEHWGEGQVVLVFFNDLI